jgi:hypothetical protein
MTPNIDKLHRCLVAVVSRHDQGIAAKVAAAVSTGGEFSFFDLAAELRIPAEVLVEQFAAEVYNQTGCLVVGEIVSEPRRLH